MSTSTAASHPTARSLDASAGRGRPRDRDPRRDARAAGDRRLRPADHGRRGHGRQGQQGDPLPPLDVKAELVIDAIERAKGAPQLVDLDTGNLRDDLIALACHKGGLNDESTVAVMAGIITALHHDQEFADAFHTRFIEPKVAESRAVYERAQRRGEIPDDVDLDLLAPVLPAIILHRAFVLRLPTDDATVARIIDEIVIPAARHGAAPRNTRT